ncbi:penicillin-binding transpeptidase domain-containing protein [Actinomadura algeriensis]|uniref:Cell division protein FtsI/penicillin-binding protein 2 n=1 Tax=Actinomadura algeriensis TaxID=1679523 RepID=A0ABR9JUE0_9ACTN|nr:penicillin-binding transpeptidase domain-containing protein [Actinomadura algeriensis]MBE1534029.1 cell division protein FtsI/penicillin-binding protein 2 [Actinomadura algeriensis]
MRRTRVLTAAAVAVVVVLAGAGAVWFLRSGDDPEAAAEEFLAAWSGGDHAAMAALTYRPPADLAQRLKQTHDDLGVTKQRYTVASVGEPDDGSAGGAYDAELTLSGGRVWSYTGTLPLVEQDGEWRVRWSPRLLYPELKDGQRLRAARAFPQRADVLAADGSSLTTSRSGSARQLAGTVGAASAEGAKEMGAPYRQGDSVGTSGLQKQYEKRLAGTPALAVQIVEGGEQDGSEVKVVKTLKRFGGADGQPLKTTIDPTMQAAASAALSDGSKPASMVAVRPSSGEILAVANRPGGYNRALMGTYPPGSTFKVVTAAALVADGVSADSRVGCPATTNVGGREFHNYQYEDFGTVAFRDAFAHSCNTTFARLAVDKLGEERLTEVAEQFGFNAPIIAGLPAVRASFPKNTDQTAFASASFGQGKVLTSPLNMASVAAAAADGTWRSPRLVDAELASQALDAGGKKPEKPHKLEPAVKKALHTLMPAVVSEGTASGVDFPAGTAGKTGTAEYGSGENPPAHAWFIGYHEDVAFAVVVEGGGEGAQAAAPIAAKFLKGL